MRNLALLVLILLAACNGRQPAGPSSAQSTFDIQGVWVSGRVVDFATGVGVSGLTVRFGDTTAVTGVEGGYLFALPAIGLYEPSIDGVRMGSSRVTGSTYRGDFLVRPGTCVSRYGTLTDGRTLRPVAGAGVSLGGQQVTSGPDGWYRIDLGCPENGWLGFNTTFIYASHPAYADKSQVVGRGIAGVIRLDLELQQR
jgi:hypothetical protein